MSREKKEKKLRDIKRPNTKGKVSSLIFSILALVLTVIVFGALLFLQNIFKEDIVYKNIVTVKEEIPEGETITIENAPIYFEMKNVNVLDAVAESLTNVDSILGARSKVTLYKGEIVTEKDFDFSYLDLSTYEEPVEISIAIGDLSNTAGGRIRAGDTINLAMMFTRDQLGVSQSLQEVPVNQDSLFYIPDMTTDNDDVIILDEEEDTRTNRSDDDEDEDEDTDEEDEEKLLDDEDFLEIIQPQQPVQLNNTDFSLNEVAETASAYVFDYYGEYVIENLRVEKALDSAGVEISTADKDSIASILIFIVDKKDELAINNALANCSNIRVSRVLNKEAQEMVVTPVEINETEDVADTAETGTVDEEAATKEN